MEDQKIETEKDDSGSKLSDLSKTLKSSSENSPESGSSTKKDLSSIHLKKITENFLALHLMARDLNVSRQNVQELVKIMGGDKKTGADVHFNTKDDKRKLLDSEVEKESKKIEESKKQTSPKAVEDSKKEKPSLFQKLKNKGIEKGKDKLGKMKKSFSESNIIKKFGKYFALAAIGGLIFLSFKDSIIEWSKGLWTTISEKF